MNENVNTLSTLETLCKEQNDYVLRHGGHLLKEADDVYNDFNRAQISAFKEQYGTAFLGNINFYGDQRIRIVAGEEGIYEEYTGQPVYNFSCAFCVPVADETLERLIRDWNRPQEEDKPHIQVEDIMSRIDELQGLHFIWY